MVIGDQQASQAFGNIQAYPTTFILDREGKVVKKHIGLMTKADLEKAIKPLL